MPKQFYRTPRNKQIAGVCSGVAEVYGMKPDTVRWLYDRRLSLSVARLLHR
ncbi:PspC domain-containing protein [Corynebacterium atrinae]|uniref:PspC domain-containing protein n=1 Tax=Corynebacterium atrinae TaxID=1336740 RepID=UPI0025B47AB3|nr:PspC domain-containing protein [Corynebacterium atrinae]